MSHKIFRAVFVLILVSGLVVVQAPQSARAAGSWYVSTTGNDADDCMSPLTPCATVNGAIGKASGGDIVYVAEGTYTGSGNEVVLIDRDITLSGGWDASFTTQSGTSTVDGQGARRGVIVNSGVTSSAEKFTIQNGCAHCSGSNSGGILNEGSMTLNNITVTNSSTNLNSAGIYNSNTLTLTNGNVIGNAGRGITNIGNMTLFNTTISNNGEGGIGNSGTLALNNSLISSNAYYGGISNSGNLTLNNSTVSGNTSQGSSGGAGIGNWGGILVLNNSTVSGNIASNGGFGGGIQNTTTDGAVTINNSTITGNMADSGPGGISGEMITIQNSIIAGNRRQAEMWDCYGQITSLGYNLIGDTINCDFTPGNGDLTNVDPLLGQLIGSSETSRYHPLLAGSPAIDAGNPAGCTDQDGNLLATDQRGVARVGTCDIGAYEYTTPGSAASLSVVDGNDQLAGTSSAFPKPLRAAVLDSQGSPVSGVTIDFTAPASGPSGTFVASGTNTIEVVTDESGVATTSTFIANDQAGAYTVSASASGLGSVNFNLEQVDRPANDNFADAEPIGSLPFTSAVDITEATSELNEPAICALLAKSVWYAYTPATDTFISAVITENIGFSIMSIYQGNGGGIENLSFRTCQAGNSSPYAFLAVAEQTYYFQIGTIAGFDGTIQFNLEQMPPPANDQFADAVDIGATPVVTNFSIGGATLEDREPNPSCLFGSPFFESVWYVFTPSESALLSATLAPAGFSPMMSVYSGTSIDALTELGCGQSGNTITFNAVSGQTYYFQIGSFFPELGDGSFLLEPTPPLVADFFYFPSNPSKFDTVVFINNSYDPGNIGIETSIWNFGDGSTESAYSPFHTYAADGIYQVTLAIETFDGRTASVTKTVEVRTHDVAITKMTTPKSASSGQTRTIVVSVQNYYYPETVSVDLYRSVAGGGYEWLGRSTQFVPVRMGNRTAEFTFNYTFTPADAQGGSVVFLAIATISTGTDVVPANNERYSSPTRVNR